MTDPSRLLAHQIHSSPEGQGIRPTLVFIHGWPDDESLWSRQVNYLKAQYRCVSVTLPNFGADRSAPNGLNHFDLVKALGATVDKVSPQTPVILIGHDWGAYLAYF